MTRGWLPVLFALLVAGCAAPPPPVVPENEAIQSGALSRTGRFAVRIEEFSGKQEAVQGGFAWFDAGDQLVLDLNSPVGAAIARVEVDASGQAVLTEANGRRTVADNADELVARVVGGTIPVGALRAWLRGRVPAQPPAQILERDDQGRPTSFIQAGWRVQIQAYDAIGPTRLQAQRDEGGRSIFLRLVMVQTGS